jgi:ribosomal protein L11 methyltransferase
MPWLQLQINSSADDAASIEKVLLDAGAVAVTLQDNANQPLFEPDLGETPLWQQTKVIGLFDADTNMEYLLTENPQLSTGKVEILEDKDWEREWMENYEAMPFGKRLWICPSWKTPPNPEAVNVLLDPGLAFGTGTHPTTALCLEWLDSQTLENCIVIDYGCGSGILSIAALLLGAKRLIAVDNDPQALLATEDNAKRNNIDPSRMQVLLPHQITEDIKADVIIANILAGPLCQLSATLLALLRPTGKLALSGILETQQKMVQAHYQSSIQFSPAAQLEEWIRLQGQKIN